MSKINSCIYFVEGECEEAFITSLKESPALITPGKIKVLNVLTEDISKSRLITITPGTAVVFVFDTDVPITEKLKVNISRVEKYCTRSKLVFLPQVRNLEDELVRCTDITKITDLTHSKSNSNFKSDFCKMSNRRVALTKHQLDVLKLWTTNPPEPFTFIPRNSNDIKKQHTKSVWQ